MSTIHTFIEEMEKEFDEKFAIGDFLNGYESSEFDPDIIKFRDDIKFHLTHSNLSAISHILSRLKEEVEEDEEIGEKKVFIDNIEYSLKRLSDIAINQERNRFRHLIEKYEAEVKGLMDITTI